MEHKDYSKWHEKKTTLHNIKKRPYFHEREVWFTTLGSNIGFEQDGRGDTFLRPVIILKKFNKSVALIIPLTKNNKKGAHYFNFTFDDNTSTAILSQIRLIDTKRLEYKIGYISKEEFLGLKQKLTQLIT